ncbi:MAG TPA: hypothetical protein VHC70_08605, partial [Phycisphaerales bacterium]|nr:hypothetical protein [Phycisphaerales bacterium]
LRRLTRTAIAPAVAALLFTVIPLHGEVVCWFNTTSTAIGAAICLAAVSLSISYARADKHRPALLLAIAAVMLLVPCFYEQSAAIAALIPFACLAISSGRPARPRIARALAATIAAAIPCTAYILLLRSTAPASARGAAGTFITPDGFSARLIELLRSARFNLLGEKARDLVIGSINLGWHTVATPTGLVTGSILLASALLWLVWIHADARRHALAKPTNPNPAWLILAGGALFKAGFLPIFLIDHQAVESRNLYIPLMGAAAILAALIDLIAAPVLRPAFHAAIATLAVIASIPGTIGLIGFQALFKARSDLDRRELAALQSLIPSPPANAEFLPLQTRASATNTGHPLFDHARRGVFETPWSGESALQWTYHRADIHCTAANPGGPPALSNPTDHDILWQQFLGRDPNGNPIDQRTIPWNNAIPFITVPDANPIRLIRRIDIQRPDHRDITIHPPIVSAAIARSHPPTSTYIFVDGEPGPDLIPIDFWEYADGSPIKLQDVRIWTDTPSNVPPHTTAATWLASPPGPRQRMSVSMPPLNRPERLLLRATMSPFDLDPKRNPTPPTDELVVTMRDDPDKALAVLRLDPQRFRRERRWIPLIVPLPPRPKPEGDRIVISIRRAADDHAPPNARALPVWITPGFEESIPLDTPSRSTTK